MPSPKTQSLSMSSLVHKRIHTELQLVATLSCQLRSTQAKLHLIRENARNALDASTLGEHVVEDLGVQYDGIGADLASLQDSWSSGRASLQMAAANAVPGRRIFSCPESNIAAGMAGIDGMQRKARRGSEAQRSDHHDAELEEEVAVLEAIAVPRQRAGGTRQERIVRMHVERELEAARRTKRDADVHLVRELKSVIRLRPQSFAGRSSRGWTSPLGAAATPPAGAAELPSIPD